ncbi:MAG: DUF3108 domain-containing protein [Methylophilaceae bacterium]|nr:DUF3108 domain-containing protein [Methylophilaceae bacterium]
MKRQPLLSSTTTPTLRVLGLALLLSLLVHVILLMPWLPMSTHLLVVAPSLNASFAPKSRLKPPPSPVTTTKKTSVKKLYKSQARTTLQSALPVLDHSVLAQPVPTVMTEALPSIQTDSETIENSPMPASAEESAPPPYQQIHTRFALRLSAQGAVTGQAEIRYQATQNNYQIDSTVTPKGLLSLFLTELKQTSRGNITSQGLQPSSYSYRQKNKPSKDIDAHFDWDSQVLQLNHANQIQSLALEADTQDLLSVMYQFMFVPPLVTTSLNVTNGKTLARYDYAFSGEETLETALGKLTTWHIIRYGENDDERFELWLATDYRYIPVKILKTETRDRHYELLVYDLHAE